MADIAARVGAGDRSDGRIDDRLQRLRGVWRVLAHQVGGSVCRHCQHDAAASDSSRACLTAHFDSERVVVAPFDAQGSGRGADRMQCAGERIGQRLHAAAKGETSCRVLPFLAAPSALACSLDLTSDQAAVALLERVQFWKSGAHAELVRIAGVNACDERLDGVVEELTSQPPNNELRNGLVRSRRCRRHERFSCQSQLSAKRKQARAQERSGRHGKWREAPVFSDVACRSRRLRLDALVGDAECREQLSYARIGVEGAVRPALVEKSLVLFRGDHAADAGRGLDDLDAHTTLCEKERGRQARQAGADDDYFRVESHAQLCIMRPLPSSRRMLELKNVSCVRGERTLFTAIGFTLERATLLRVSGANGTGKTSLLRIICGLMLPADGEVHWEGESIRTLREDYWRNLVYVGHMNALKDDLTAIENLELGAALAGRPAARESARDALNAFDLAHCASLPVRVLSQGQRRRVALARLVMSRAAPLWVLDEPFTALDARAVQFMQRLVGEHVSAGGAAILTTHQDVQIDAPVQRRLDLDAC